MSVTGALPLDCGFSHQLDSWPLESTLLCSHHISELAAWVGLCRGWAVEAVAHPPFLGVFPRGGAPAPGSSVKPWKDPGLALRQTRLQSSFCWELAV